MSALLNWNLWKTGYRAKYGADFDSDLQTQIKRAAEETEREPSIEQRKAGNYRKGRFRMHGLEFSIETPRGAFRRGVSGDGTEWKTKMPHHYGYIKQTESEADGDHIDVFIGSDLDSERVFVIDQRKKDGETFDEHKVMLGFDSADEAEGAYRSAYDDDWNGFGSITEMSLPEFKDWLESGDTSKPVA